MQDPTCQDTFVRSVHDVHRIFYAVLLGKLPMITRRLDAQERDALRAGCCYVWEDRGPHSITGLGIERFTEGRHWSPSRVRDDFLFYYECFKGASEEYVSHHRLTPRSLIPADSQRPPRDWDPLVKQTYSVFVNPNPGEPEPSPPKKWHLTAYYTENSIDRMHSVDDLLATKDLIVPEGIFRCSRTVKPR
ncbi:Gti1/Pac2 family-domain-containing protein, partial [Vararia minispora EC-137]